MEPFENVGNLLEDLGMFEAATHAPPLELPAVEVTKVLAARDQSDQDETLRRLAGSMASLLQASVVEVSDRRDADGIQAAIHDHQAGMLVLPVPFGSDIGLLREASLGDVVDRLLGQIRVPVLAVRQPLTEEESAAVLRRIVVPLAPGDARNPAALAWACRLSRSGGELILVEIADREVLSEASQLSDPTNPSPAESRGQIERVMTRRFASLVAAVQRAAQEAGFNTQIVSATGRFVAETLAVVGAIPTLVIAAGSSDRRSTAFHRCADLILDSRYPVLVV